MTLQYKREYELSIFDRSVERIIRDLRLQFKVTKSLRSYPNLAEIRIFNANRDTQALLKQRLTKVKLQAGYGINRGLIFTGQIRNVARTRQGPDHITIIYAGDGQKDWERAYYNKTLQSNISISALIKDLASTFTETVLGELKGLTMPANKLRGQSLSGATRDILNTLGEDYGFQWSVQDGVFTTIPDEETSDSVVVTVINNRTGMIGEPTITEIGADVKTLLNPALIPNGTFKIESSARNFQLGNLNFRSVPRTTATGFYKIFEVVHEGDTHEKPWYSSLVGRFISG